MSSSTLPRIPLFIRIKVAKVKEEFANGSTSLCGNPPTSVECYEERAGTDSGWLVWSEQSQLKRASPDELTRKKDYKTSSVFWCTDCEKYKAIPSDCLVRDVELDDENSWWTGWQPLHFEFKPFRPSGSTDEFCLSILGHKARDACQEDRLGACAPPGLIPSFLPTSNENIVFRGFKGPTQIAGDLSLIFALSLLSGPQNQWRSNLASFRPGKSWNPKENQSGSQRENRCGLVVSVGFDGRNFVEDEIEQWANGNFGGLITDVP